MDKLSRQFHFTASSLICSQSNDTLNLEIPLFAWKDYLCEKKGPPLKLIIRGLSSVHNIVTSSSMISFGARKYFLRSFVDQDSVVGIATRYGLDDPVIETQWGLYFQRTRLERPWSPPYLLYKGVPGHSEV